MTLSAPEAYRRWAPHYDDETAVTLLEARLADQLAPAPPGGWLLDAACGTGRRLPPSEVCRAIGVDLVPAMLTIGWPRTGPRLVASDVRALPLPDARFDVVWCRLALGHLADADTAYRELARVTRPGGILLVTDVHPAASLAGHRRTFRDADGTLHEIEHHPRSAGDHRAAAHRAGWSAETEHAGEVGPEVHHLYADAGRLDQYGQDRGLPLVLALRFRA